MLLVSCGGGGGGGGGGTAGPSTVAKFVSNSITYDYVFVFNSNGSCVQTSSMNGVAVDVDNNTWSFQNGDFNNGTLNFTAPRNPTITITNGAFNYTADGGSGNTVPFTKAATSTGLATFNGSESGAMVLDFKSNNTVTMSGTGALSYMTPETGSYSITSGDFNNGVVALDWGDTITISNGSFSFTETMNDVNGNPANMTMTFTKQ